MYEGLYDYPKLADRFSEFVEEYVENHPGGEDNEKMLLFAIDFKNNACYNLPNIRDKAISQGQNIIGLPVNIKVQNDVSKVKEPTVAEVTVAEIPKFETPRKNMFKKRDSIQRQGKDLPTYNDSSDIEEPVMATPINFAVDENIDK